MWRRAPRSRRPATSSSPRPPGEQWPGTGWGWGRPRSPAHLHELAERLTGWGPGTPGHGTPKPGGGAGGGGRGRERREPAASCPVSGTRVQVAWGGCEGMSTHTQKVTRFMTVLGAPCLSRRRPSSQTCEARGPWAGGRTGNRWPSVQPSVPTPGGSTPAPGCSRAASRQYKAEELGPATRGKCHAISCMREI